MDMHSGAAEQLWPSANYQHYLQRLREAIGQRVFLTEINMTDINAGVQWSDKAYKLLGVVDYPEPDPYRQLYPHLLIIDDGRGINLGHIARISLHQAFLPAPNDIVYENTSFLSDHLYAPRQLSRHLLKETSKALLADMFGPEAGRLLAEASTSETPLLTQASTTRNKLVKKSN
nr:hypothetical protein [Thiolinea disciformis]